MKKVYVFLAEGFEEMEAVAPIDLLRRAGVDAKLVSVTGNRAVTGAHGVTYLADLLFEEIEEDADMLVLPGGLPGTTNLQAHEGLTKLLLKQHEAHKWVAAICAAPMVLGALGIVKDRHATIYPGTEDKLIGAAPLTDEVVVDGNVIHVPAPSPRNGHPLCDCTGRASDGRKDSRRLRKIWYFAKHDFRKQDRQGLLRKRGAICFFCRFSDSRQGQTEHIRRSFGCIAFGQTAGNGSVQHAAKRIFTFRKQAKKDALRDVGEVLLLHARCQGFGRKTGTSATAALSYGGCSVFKKISIISICGCMLRR